MKIKDYILGRRVDLTSPLDREAAEQAIRSGIKSGFNPFYTGVVGWCRFGRVGLRWATAMWGNGFQPVFRGKIAPHLGGTRLEGRFGAPPVLLIFFSIWYLVLALAAVSTLSAYVNNAQPSANSLGMLLGLLLLAFVPVGFHLIFNRGADRHFVRILDVLEKSAGFETDSDSP